MPPKKLIQLRIDEELHAALRRAADDDGRTMTQFIRRLITLACKPREDDSHANG